MFLIFVTFDTSYTLQAEVLIEFGSFLKELLHVRDLRHIPASTAPPPDLRFRALKVFRLMHELLHRLLDQAHARNLVSARLPRLSHIARE